MSLFDMDLDFSGGSDSSFNTDNYSLSEPVETFSTDNYSPFYAESDWDSSFDSSFDSAIAPISDNNWWSGISKFANTQVGSGLITGAASGALGYLSDKSQAEVYGKALADKQQTRNAHNASINKPFTGAKEVSFNKEAPKEKRPDNTKKIQSMFASKFK